MLSFQVDQITALARQLLTQPRLRAPLDSVPLRPKARFMAQTGLYLVKIEVVDCLIDN